MSRRQAGGREVGASRRGSWSSPPITQLFPNLPGFGETTHLHRKKSKSLGWDFSFLLQSQPDLAILFPTLCSLALNLGGA